MTSSNSRQLSSIEVKYMVTLKIKPFLNEINEICNEEPVDEKKIKKLVDIISIYKNESVFEKAVEFMKNHELHQTILSLQQQQQEQQQEEEEDLVSEIEMVEFDQDKVDIFFEDIYSKFEQTNNFKEFGFRHIFTIKFDENEKSVNES